MVYILYCDLVLMTGILTRGTFIYISWSCRCVDLHHVTCAQRHLFQCWIKTLYTSIESIIQILASNINRWSLGQIFQVSRNGGWHWHTWAFPVYWYFFTVGLSNSLSLPPTVRRWIIILLGNGDGRMNGQSSIRLLLLLLMLYFSKYLPGNSEYWRIHINWE